MMLGLAATACAHVGPITDLTPVSADSRPIYVSRSCFADGPIQTVVVERALAPSETCERVEFTRYDYDSSGELAQRRREQVSCGVVDLEVVDRFDPADQTVETTRSRDANHDGTYDDQRVSITAADELPPTPEDELLLEGHAGGDSCEQAIRRSARRNSRRPSNTRAHVDTHDRD